MAITYSPAHYFAADLVGGIQEHEIAAGREKLLEVYTKVQAEKRAGNLGFSKLPYAEETVAEVTALAESFRKLCKDVVVIGIGGSDLGARAAHRALNHQFYNLDSSTRSDTPRLFFAGDTTDPVALAELMDILDWQQTGLVMVSKSGNTIEQMSTFLILRDGLVRAVGAEEATERIITITDAEEGTLRELTRQEGYRSLVIPKDAGGRFSILSAVGLFPLALAGVDIAALLTGARELDASEQTKPSMAAEYALHQYLAYTLRDQKISVIFPYAYSLREFGMWFRQLWAESLGKKLDLAGTEVKVGPTPVAALGPTDQHSQVQLYMEGPNDKLITFVRVEGTERDLSVPEAFPNLEGIHYLRGISLQRILLAEQKATAEALAQQSHPSVELSIPHLDAFHLGQLFYFFELATAYAGGLFNVNAYDQPGVELGKQLMYRDLGRPGF